MKRKLFIILLVVTTIFITTPKAFMKANAFTANDIDEIRFTSPTAYSSNSLETFDFVSREIVETNTTYKNCPAYTDINTSHTNECGAIAGANIVGFYDRYYEELIPNYVTYLTGSGNYKPTGTTAIPQLMNDLYVLMRTNVDDVGVSESDFLNGLTQYVNNHERNKKGKT